MVRVILVDTTLPVRMRPRMETSPVKGHFLSVQTSQVKPVHRSKLHTNVSAIDRLLRRLEAKTNVLVPPLILGSNLLACGRSRLRILVSHLITRYIPFTLAFWKMGCFWNAFSI